MSKASDDVVRTVRPWMISAAIMAVALGIRLLGIGALEVWHDEACSVLTATSPRGIWGELRLDTNAPLYFLLLKGWIGFAGIRAAGIRLLSALCGTLTVGVVGLWARECGASQRSSWWAMGLCTVAPMQVYYSQEARPYALVCLLVALALWTFVRAMKSERMVDWGAHGAVIVLGAYTHNVFLPWVLGFWIFAAMARPSRRQWTGLLMAHAAAAIAFLPGALLVLGQMAHSGGAEWITRYWLQTPPALAIPSSLEVLSIAGRTSELIRWVPLDGFWRWVGIGVAAFAGVAALWPAKGGARVEVRGGGWREFGRFRWLLVVFTLWPLVDLWLYSVLRKPIYIVGRYDVLSQPAYLTLLALGLDRLAGGGRRPRGAAGVLGWGVALVLVAVMAGGVWQRFEAGRKRSHSVEELREEFLTGNGVVQRNDVVVCMTLEAAITSYYFQREGISCELRTLPAETLSHIGWEQPMAYTAARLPQVRAEIEQLFEEAERRGRRRVWVVLNQTHHFPWEGLSARDVDDQITRMTFEAAAARGWTLTPGSVDLAKMVHTVTLDRPVAAATGG